jgi:hypothetical protein
LPDNTRLVGTGIQELLHGFAGPGIDDISRNFRKGLEDKATSRKARVWYGQAGL